MANDIQGTDGVQPGTATLVPGTLTGAGSLFNNGDGTFTYTPAAGEQGPVTFDYSITDGTGDVSIATVTIALQPTQSGRVGMQVIVPDASGVVVLPAGTELGDIRIEGRDLVIIGADGVRYVIPDGAIVVPQLVIDDVAIPPLNLAALLVGNEPEPAAGNPQSSGGNFAGPVGPLQDAYGLGDLLPYTELNFPQPEQREVLPGLVDREPDIAIEIDNSGVSVINAVDAVNEAGLPARGAEPAGSNSAANSESTYGYINFDSPDGTGTVTLNGVAIAQIGQTFTTSVGVLTITSIEDGRIGYSYTLTDNTTTASADNFAVTITDPDGDMATATLRIDIIDDVPTAANDTASLAVGTYGPIAGNVLTNDTQGADGASVTGYVGTGAPVATGGVATGAYGTLTIAADGTFSYTRNPGSPGGVTDTFTYTITDGDGDPATATLTITVPDSDTSLDVPTAGEAGTSVLEEALATGSNPSSTEEATSGTITFTAPDGPAILTIDGVPVTVGATIAGAFGTLVIDAVTANTISYTYTLTTNTSGDNTADSFTVRVEDQDGDFTESDLVVAIVDDVPTALPDTNSVAEGASVDGNVLTDGADDVLGADGAAAGGAVTGVVAGTDTSTPVSGNVGTTISGTYGTLTLNADGSYTYDGTPNTVVPPGAEDTFVYTITDADGDTSTTTLTINLSDVTLVADNDTQTVYEAALDTSQTGDDVDAGTVTGSNPSATTETVTGQLAVTGATGYTLVSPLTGTYGTLVLNADGSYTYTLTAPVDNLPHANDGNDTEAAGEVFTYEATDANGNTVQGTITIDIVDDVPTANADTDSVTEGGVADGNVVTGSGGSDANGSDGVPDEDGADGFAASPTGIVTGIASTNQGTSDATVDGSGNFVLAGEWGTLTLNRDGSYSYQSDADAITGAEQDVFTYTVIDADGDTSTTTLTINLSDVTLVADNDTQTVYEAALDTSQTGDDVDAGTVTGSNPSATTETVTGQLAVTGATGYTLVSPLTGTYGTLVLNADGSYTYTLTAPVDNLPHANDGNDTEAAGEVFTYEATDANGNTVQGTITIDIVDDVPTANADTDSVTEGGVADGNVVTGSGGSDANGSDGVPDEDGADGFAASPTGIVTGIASTNQGTSDATVDGSGNFVLAGEWGTLTLNRDGSYSYQSDADAITGAEQDVFTYTVIDADGDTSTTTLTINLSDVTLVADNDTQTVYEAALDTSQTGDDVDAGTVTGSNPSATTETVTGQLAVTGATGYTLVSPLTGTYGTLVLNADGSYTYTLTAPVDNLPHANDGNDTEAAGEVFTYEATDANGNTVQGTITIDIVDDVPTANADTDSVTEGGVADGNVVTGSGGSDANGSDGVPDEDGADGFAASPTGIVTGIASTNQGTSDATVDGSGNFVLAGEWGTLTLNRDGSYSYQSDADAITGAEQDVFTYTVIDADGDTSTTTLTINLSDVTLVADNDTQTVYEAALDTSQTGDDVDAGTVTGSNPSATTETVTGQLAVTGATGYTLVSPLTGTYGTLVLNADGSYTYTLTAPVDNLPHANDGNDTEAAGEVFTYEATDANGNTVQGTITIDIVDDVPTANADTDSVTEGGVADGNVVTGSGGSDANGSDGVPDEDGADGFAASPTGIVTGIASTNQGTSDATVDGSGNFVLAGEWGTLTLNRDGSYSYQSDADAITGAEQDVFTYTVIDADGDTSTTTLTINLSDVTLVADNDTQTVYEAALDTSQTGDDVDAGTVTGSNPSATTETVTGQLAVTGATGYTLVSPLTGTYGTLVLNADGSYTYTLTAPVDNLPHANDGNDTEAAGEVFTYEATDANGNTVQGTITIDIVDDVPTANADTDSVTEGGVADGNVVTGSGGSDANGSDGVPDEDGADGFAASPTGIVTGIASTNQGTSDATVDGSGNFVLAGEWGTLTLNRDGSYSYQSDADAITGAEQDVFTYTVIDADGDTSTTTLTINLSDVTVTATDTDALVNEKGLAAGGSGENADGIPGNGSDQSEIYNGSITPAGGTGPYTYTLTSSASGSYGNLVLNANGTYTYTLTQPYDTSPDANNGTNTEQDRDSFTYTVTDANGNTATGTILVDIVDDVPTAVAPDWAVLQNVAGSATLFDLDSDDNVANNYGADGAGLVRFAGTLEDTNSGLTHGGQIIWYTLDATGQVLTGETRVGNVAGGAPVQTVFQITLQPGADDNSYSVQVFAPVDSFTDLVFSDAAYDFVGGNETWAGYVLNGQVEGKPGNTPVDDNSSDLLLTPIGTGTAINGTANSAGVTGGIAGQNIGSGEGIRLDFVNDLSGIPTAGDYNDLAEQTHDFDAHYEVNGATLRFGDGTSTQTTASFKAFTISPLIIDPQNPGVPPSGDDNVANLVDGTGTLVSVTSIAIVYDGEKEIVAFDPLDLTPTYVVEVGNPGGLANRTYTVTFVQDVPSGEWYATVTGIYDELVTISTFAEVNYSALEVLHLGPSDANADFEITGFSIALQSTDPVLTSLPIEIVDGDGDTAASSLNVAFTTGAVQDNSNALVGDTHTYTATGGQPNVIGSDFNDTITGDSGDNTLSGGQGVDVLSGGAGNDTLIGGAGVDSLSGGLGKDTFVVDPADLTGSTDDTISDYSFAQGDAISLVALFDSLGLNAPTSAAAAATVVKLYNGVLYVDADGTGSGTTFVPVITITGDPASVLVIYNAGAVPITINESPSQPPIALDLDGDGVEYLGLSAGVTFDYGSGQTGTAWVGGDDGLLAIDRDGNGAVSGSEIVFGGNGLTDLEGVAAQYDTSHDGVLDANDAEFTKFGVWQDVNQNGVFEAGEFHSLDELGITSIGLTSDGDNYLTANGDVLVNGEATFVRNGVSYSLADTAFATEARVAQRTAEVVTTAAVAAAFANAAAAVAAVPPAADFEIARDLPATEQTRVAIETVDAHESTAPSSASVDALADMDAPAEAPRTMSGADTDEAQPALADLTDREVATVDHAAVDDAGSHALSSAAATLFASAGTEGLMQALMALAPGQALAGEDGSPAGAVLADALSDFAGTKLVDTIVDHFTSADTPAIALAANDTASALLVQLGDGAGMSMPFHDVMTAMADADAHAIAAAQA